MLAQLVNLDKLWDDLSRLPEESRLPIVRRAYNQIPTHVSHRLCRAVDQLCCLLTIVNFSHNLALTYEDTPTPSRRNTREAYRGEMIIPSGKSVIQEDYSMEEEKVVYEEDQQSRSLTLTHTEIPFDYDPTSGLSAMLIPLVPDIPEEEEDCNGLDYTCRCCGTVPNLYWQPLPDVPNGYVCNICRQGRQIDVHICWSMSVDFKRTYQSRLFCPRFVVVLEIDAQGQITKRVERFVDSLTHFRVDLLIFSPQWNTFILRPLQQNANIDRLRKEIAKETEKARRQWSWSWGQKPPSLLALERAAALMEEQIGKIVFIKTQSLPLDKITQKWIDDNCSEHLIDIYGCCDMKADDLLPNEIQKKIEQNGGCFSCATELHLEKILPDAFGVSSKEIFRVKVQLFTSPELKIKNGDQTGAREGHEITYKAKRLREGQCLKVGIEPVKTDQWFPGKEVFIQAVTQCVDSNG